MSIDKAFDAAMTRMNMDGAAGFGELNRADAYRIWNAALSTLPLGPCPNCSYPSVAGIDLRPRRPTMTDGEKITLDKILAHARRVDAFLVSGKEWSDPTAGYAKLMNDKPDYTELMTMVTALVRITHLLTPEPLVKVGES